MASVSFRKETKMIRGLAKLCKVSKTAISNSFRNPYHHASKNIDKDLKHSHLIRKRHYLRVEERKFHNSNI